MAWEIDTSHSEIAFSVKHMMITTVRGKFTSFSGDVSLDPSDVEHAKAIGTVEVASITTGEEKRDAHLRSADFFDVERFPRMRFETTRIVRDGEDLRVTGNLTIRDATHEITLKGTVAGPAKDPWGGQRVGFELDGEVDREAFGLTWNVALEAGGVLVGKKVKIHLALEAVQK